MASDLHGELTRIIAEMRTCSRHQSHDLGNCDSIYSWLVDQWADELAAALAAESRPPTTQYLTVEDIDQIVEGIEHFIIGLDDDKELRAIWQPYIDKLEAQKPPVAAESRPKDDQPVDLVARPSEPATAAGEQRVSSSVGHVAAESRSATPDQTSSVAFENLRKAAAESRRESASYDFFDGATNICQKCGVVRPCSIHDSAALVQTDIEPLWHILEQAGEGTVVWNNQVRDSRYRFLPYQPLGRDAGT